MKPMTTRNLTRLGILLTLALLSFMLENMFPPLIPFAPYIRLGISNLFIFIAFILCGLPAAGLLMVAKCILGAMFSSPFALWYSLPSGCCSLLVMFILMQWVFPKIGLITVSATAAMVHNVVQLGMYSYLSGSFEIFYFLPITCILSIVAGGFVGAVVCLCIKRLPLPWLRGDR